MGLDFFGRWRGITPSEWSEVMNPSETNFVLDPRISTGEVARDWLYGEINLERNKAWVDAWMRTAVSVETGISRDNKELDGMFDEFAE